jgi:glycosyltransferase involved in cell wall biosynthesis
MVGEKRNVGIREARGEYLAVWDDDDVSLPWRLADQMNAALTWKSDCVLADDMYVADGDLRIVGNCDRGQGMFVQGSALLRRNAVVAAGGYQAADYKEDAELIERLRYVARGKVTTMRGCRWYVYRRHGGNVTLGWEEQDKWTRCAAGDPAVVGAQATVDAIRRGPGGDDVVGSWAEP